MIRILLFAELQEKVGKDQIEYPLESITVRELKQKLKEERGLLNLDHVMTAVNEEYATEEDLVKAGDTVALIPPVSGG